MKTAGEMVDVEEQEKLLVLLLVLKEGRLLKVELAELGVGGHALNCEVGNCSAFGVTVTLRLFVPVR